MRPQDLRLTHHAREQMAARHIAIEEVAEALEEPETTYLSPRRDDRLTILGVTKAGRRLKVVVPSADRRVIITVADRDQEE
jgi:Domain of unknown function (DUF4258)